MMKVIGFAGAGLILLSATTIVAQEARDFERVWSVKHKTCTRTGEHSFSDHVKSEGTFVLVKSGTGYQIRTFDRSPFGPSIEGNSLMFCAGTGADYSSPYRLAPPLCDDAELDAAHAHGISTQLGGNSLCESSMFGQYPRLVGRFAPPADGDHRHVTHNVVILLDRAVPQDPRIDMYLFADDGGGQHDGIIHGDIGTP